VTRRLDLLDGPEPSVLDRMLEGLLGGRQFRPIIAARRPGTLAAHSPRAYSPTADRVTEMSG